MRYLQPFTETGLLHRTVPFDIQPTAKALWDLLTGPEYKSHSILFYAEGQPVHSITKRVGSKGDPYQLSTYSNITEEFEDRTTYFPTRTLNEHTLKGWLESLDFQKYKWIFSNCVYFYDVQSIILKDNKLTRVDSWNYRPIEILVSDFNNTLGRKLEPFIPEQYQKFYAQ